MKANRYVAKTIYVLDQLDQKTHNAPPVLLLSSAGTGKTSTVRKYCEYMDYNLITLIPSQCSGDDVLGLQIVDHETNRMKRLTPSWFNRMKDIMKNGKRTVLFIDEISTCDAYIQGPLLDLIFSHNLGEEALPENVFIVAAGNYSSDLNNEFRMSAPLVNRFLLLNLEKSDYSINEIINNVFEDMDSKEDIGKFLGIEKKKNFKPLNSFDKFTSWIKTSKEIIFGKTNVEEDPDIGLLGFTSVRSLTYCLKFAKEYFNTFDDNEWIRVVGDTLGSSNKRDTKSGDGIPMRSILDTYKDEFLSDDEETTNESIIDICKRMKRMGISDIDLEKLSTILDMMDPSDLTEEDINEFKTLNNVTTAEDWSNDKLIKVISKFTEITKASKSSRNKK